MLIHMLCLSVSIYLYTCKGSEHPPGIAVAPAQEARLPFSRVFALPPLGFIRGARTGTATYAPAGVRR